jgi:hypothetical protein
MDALAEYTERIRPEIYERIGPARPTGPGLVFPSFGFLPNAIGSVIGVWHPKTADTFEFWRWMVIDAASTPEEREMQTRWGQVWPYDLGDADDGENWSLITANLRSPRVRKMKFNYSMGIGQERELDSEYPGDVGVGAFVERAHRHFYRRWLEFMVPGEAWPAVPPQSAAVPAAAGA